jgi:hypothetical protein
MQHATGTGMLHAAWLRQTRLRDGLLKCIQPFVVGRLLLLLNNIGLKVRIMDLYSLDKFRAISLFWVGLRKMHQLPPNRILTYFTSDPR